MENGNVVSERGASEQGASGHGVSEEGVSGHGVSEQGASGPVGPEAGIVTAEYAIATLAAAAFAGVLLLILRSGEVRAFLLGIIRQALSV